MSTSSTSEHPIASPSRSVNSRSGPFTPIDPNISTILREAQDSTNDDDRSTKRAKYIKLTPDQFNRLLDTCSKQQARIDQLSTSIQGSSYSTQTRSSNTPSYYANAKYEEISCKPIKPLYNGSEDSLVPFLTKLDLRRQNEGWASATFITVNHHTYDLTCNFTNVNETEVTNAAISRWTSPSIDTDKHTVGHETYNSRLLAIVLLGSISEDLLTTILHRIPHTLRNDGTLILWTLSNNVYRNNVAFTEKVREKIRSATLNQFNNDVSKYLIFIKDNLRMITTSTTTEHNGLITYIFCQLKSSSVPLFQDYIRKQHVKFQEAKLPNITVSSLITTVEDKIRVLRNAGEWIEANDVQPSAMALAAPTTIPPQLEDIMIKHIKHQLKQLVDYHKQPTNTKQGSGHYREWKYNTPKNLNEIRTHNGKQFKWCTKCNHGKGQWASGHDTDTHVDGFRFQRNSQNNRQQCTGILKNGRTTQEGTPTGHVSFLDQSSELTTDGQVSLQQGIENCFDFVDPDEE
jgi:hypothetical protein